MNILNFNILDDALRGKTKQVSGLSYNPFVWDERFERICSEIIGASNNYDIICLNEVNSNDVYSKFYERFHDNYYLCYAAKPWPLTTQKHGNLLMFKKMVFEIEMVGVESLIGTEKEYNAIFQDFNQVINCALVKFKSRQMLVVGVHLMSGGYTKNQELTNMSLKMTDSPKDKLKKLNNLKKVVTREVQLNFLFDFVNKIKGQAMAIVLGDFNEYIPQKLAEVAKKYNFVDTFETYCTKFPKAIIPCKRTNIDNNAIRSESSMDPPDTVLDKIYIDAESDRETILTVQNYYSEQEDMEAFEQANLSDHFPLSLIITFRRDFGWKIGSH